MRHPGDMDEDDIRHEPGWESLGFKIIVRAVRDVQGLRRNGGLIGDVPPDPWPMHTTKRGHTAHRICYHGYKFPNQVKELVSWLRSRDLDTLLHLIGAKTPASEIRRGLGL